MKKVSDRGFVEYLDLPFYGVYLNRFIRLNDVLTQEIDQITIESKNSRVSSKINPIEGFAGSRS